jgi:hypothetical protein
MEVKETEQKKEKDNSETLENVEVDGFTADELGEASAYQGVTEIAQAMRRGDEPDNDDKDVVGVESEDAPNTRKEQ